MACEKTIVLSKDTNLAQVIGKIKELAVSGSDDPRIKRIAQTCASSDSPSRCAFNLVYSLVLYEPDPDDRQILKAVHCTLDSGKGNCVDYSILLGAILLNLNIPYVFKVVSFSTPNAYDHIYIVLKDGSVLDPVLGQRQDGTDTRSNRPINGEYGNECSFKYSKKFEMPSLEILQGVKPVTIVSRTEAFRMGVLNGLTKQQMYTSRIGQLRTMQGVFGQGAGTVITSNSGVSVGFGSVQNSSGDFPLSGSAAFATPGTAGIEMFFSGDVLYLKNSAGVMFVNDGSGWQFTDAVTYNAAKAIAVAASAVTGISTPVLIGGGVLLMAGAWYFFFRKKGKK